MNTRFAMLFVLFFYYSLSSAGQPIDSLSISKNQPANVSDQNAASSGFSSAFELGTGLSFTGYNANFSYAGQFNQNVIFLGPKIVYSDANALFDAPWGLHLGYRRLFPIKRQFFAFVSAEYQSIFFRFDDLGGKEWNSIHEFHASYGFRYCFDEHWYISQSLGLGGYIERLLDPFDQRVDTFEGFSPQIRLWMGYQW